MRDDVARVQLMLQAIVDAVDAEFGLYKAFVKTAKLKAKHAAGGGKCRWPHYDLDDLGWEPGDGYVYLFSSPHGYKIGKTRRMKHRSRLFSVKLPFDIELVHFAWFANYSQAELALHRRYARKRLSGEWFDLTPTEIDEIRKFTLP